MKPERRGRATLNRTQRLRACERCRWTMTWFCLIVPSVLALLPANAQRADTVFLDLATAVTRALRQSDEARLAMLTVDAASAQLAGARASVLPQVTLNSSYSQVTRNARAEIVGNLFGQSYNYSSNLNVSQTVFQGGREVFALRSATHTRDAARLNAEETRALLQVTVQRAYLDALYATRVATIQATNLLLARERTQQVEQLATGGRAARYDVLRARVEASNLEPVVLQAANARTLAELELRRILNLPPDQPLVLTTDLDESSARSIIALVGDETAVATTRPGVRAAELAYRARRDLVGVARGGFLPTISVFLRTGFLALPGAPGVPWGVGRTSTSLCPEGAPPTRVCQNDGWFRDESFGVQVSWPLFDGLRARSDMQAARTQARIAELQWREREELNTVELERARAEFQRARAVFAAQQSTVSEATEAFSLASLRFTRGLGTQLDVSDAQFALITAQSNEARSVYALHLAAAELARTLGQPIPLPPTTTLRRSANDQ